MTLPDKREKFQQTPPAPHTEKPGERARINSPAGVNTCANLDEDGAARKFSPDVFIREKRKKTSLVKQTLSYFLIRFMGLVEKENCFSIRDFCIVYYCTRC